MESSQPRHNQSNENTRDSNMNQRVSSEHDMEGNNYSDRVIEHHDHTTQVKRDDLGNVLLHLIDPDAELVSLDISKDEW